MDSIAASALEEICSAGAAGLPIIALWPRLRPTLSAAGLPPGPAVFSPLWLRLLVVPGLQFVAADGVSYDCADPLLQSVNGAEMLGVKIVAPEHLRDSFVGLYDLGAADTGISPPQRRALGLLASARTNGITQSQLSKEFGKNGNNMFFIVRNLESQGLVTRHSTVVRTKESCNEGESCNSSTVTTNMIYLCRYARHLGSHQRLEITKEDKSLDSSGNVDEGAEIRDGAAGEHVKEEVLVKDFLPALKAICDKLEAASGKVLVVSDIKRDLGYRGTQGHRRWRNICRRLKDAGVVEEFRAKVNKKEANCLRLVKKFSPESFEQKSLGCANDNFEEHPVKFGKRGQITDQLVELPIEHQIHDIIDAEGPNGLTLTEVCRRLGINNKKNYTRLLNMFSRFGMHLQAENCNRGKVYRVWTSRNFKTNSNAGDLVSNEMSAQIIPLLNPPTPQDDIAISRKVENRVVDAEFSHAPLQDGDCMHMLPSPNNQQEVTHELRGAIPSAELDLLNVATKLDGALIETSPVSSLKTQKFRSYQKYPCLTLTAINAEREQRIVERLQEEKFILRAELHRWLKNLKQDKNTIMDRRTLIRILNKLQQQGQCRCIDISVPILTNYHRSRTAQVVLHPSVTTLSPELLGQIHERLRSFDMQVRGQGSSRLKSDPSVPILNDVERSQNRVDSDVKAVKSEIMRANGFVMAKMVRAKLLHGFLWSHLSSVCGWGEALASGKHGCDLQNPHSSCKLFALDAAIKAIPLELYLQVVGSTQKVDDMIDKCKRGLRLSDLPVQEYKCLMDTHATGRLSWIIDILQRLKLIRLVTDGHSQDGEKVPHATLTHAMELKPYIEEPLSIVIPSSIVGSFDLRPRKRHDFFLSNRKAVDVYWKTLEYCYAAADPTAALHAFPGSAVHEVFLYRSWASVRVMTADQRAELLKRIVNDDSCRKLSFQECEKIAKDLNLTLEQVLRVYYDKRHQRLNRYQGHSKEGFQHLKNVHVSSSQKRKKSLEGKSMKRTKVDSVPQCLGAEEENLNITSSGAHGSNFPKYQVDDHLVNGKEPVSCEEDEVHYSFISQCAFSKIKLARRKRFSWTEEADRQLIIQYVRHRAALGAKFHRTDWASLPDLPAHPSTCRRRMQLLNSNIKFRKSIMRLCTFLSERYARHLNKIQNRCLNHDDKARGSLGESFLRNFSTGIEHTKESYMEDEKWDDFECESIEKALDEVLRYKQMAKYEACRGIESASEEWSDLNVGPEEDHRETLLGSSASPSVELQNSGRRRFNHSSRRSHCHRLPRKFVKLWNDGTSVGRRAYESLAVSNAVELFKLVFLSTSAGPEVPNFLAETLRRYSEHDLFAAFDYLREKKIMVADNGSHPFVLSQQFLQSVSSSPFPSNTGKRAAKFASWLTEREKDMMEEGINLSADLQCGDILHLFGLVSSGELFIAPCLPDEGVGETEDPRGSKRKIYGNEFCNDDQAKKLKSVLTEGEVNSRKEKGFPGIMVSLTRETISGANAVDCCSSGDFCTGSPCFPENDKLNTILGPKIGGSSSCSDDMKDFIGFGSVVPPAQVLSESLWEAMASYARCTTLINSDEKQLSPFYPELFRTVYAAIQRAGDQGLRMKEVSEVTHMQGEKMSEGPEFIVEVLQAFGRVLKVNSYDCEHVVDALYRPKYCLTSVASSSKDLKPSQSTKCLGASDEGHLILPPENLDGNLQRESSMNIDDVHKVTILNLPEEVGQSSDKIQTSEELECCLQGEVVTQGEKHESEIFEFSSTDSNLCRPILPWINGDGTINRIVYKGLSRRVMGAVMQNPGILEEDIIHRLDVLNPQSCRKLLELMILDNHLIVRKMLQTTSDATPSILESLLGSSFKKPESIFRKHFFANPTSTSLL